MKARVVIIALVLSLSIFTLTCKDSGESNNDKETNNLLQSDSPCWSKDGKIAFVGTDQDWNYAIYVMNADGGKKIKLADDIGIHSNPCWSPDGKKIAFSAFKERNSDKEGISEICILELDTRTK